MIDYVLHVQQVVEEIKGKSVVDYELNLFYFKEEMNFCKTGMYSGICNCTSNFKNIIVYITNIAAR